MTQLYEIKVSLSPNQKKNLSNAYHKRETIVLRLTKDSLSGNDTLYVPLKFTIKKYPTVKHSVVKPKFHKNIPLSNFDLIDWCKYLNIPIKDVLSRDEIVPHNHRQALFIYNLEPSYMSGSHWIASYVKDKVVITLIHSGCLHFKK